LTQFGHFGFRHDGERRVRTAQHLKIIDFLGVFPRHPGPKTVTQSGQNPLDATEFGR
jgi:hypothetical protein